MSETSTILDETEIDGRSDRDKRIDEALGATEQTKFDRQVGNVVKAANELYGAKALRKYLLLGEACDATVRMFTGPVKREDLVKRLEDRLSDEGIGNSAIRVNDWIAVYNLACLITGKATVKDMPADFVSGHSYFSLAAMKVGIERGGTDYKWKDGWKPTIMSAIDAGIVGGDLADLLDDHKTKMDEAAVEAHRKSLTPERAAAEARREADALRDKATKQLKSLADKIADKAKEFNVSPEDLLAILVNRGVIPPMVTQVVATSEKTAEAA